MFTIIARSVKPRVSAVALCASLIGPLTASKAYANAPLNDATRPTEPMTTSQVVPTTGNKSELTRYAHTRILGLRVNTLTCCGVPELLFDVAHFNVWPVSPRSNVGFTALTADATGSNYKDPTSSTETWTEHYSLGVASVHYEYLVATSNFANLLFEIRTEPLSVTHKSWMLKDETAQDPSPQTLDTQWSWSPNLDAGLFVPLLIGGTQFYFVGFGAGYHLATADHAATARLNHGAHLDIVFALGYLDRGSY